MDDDDRRKLAPIDYSRIKLMLGSNYTKRQIASMYSVSTKYVGKIEDGYFEFTNSGTAVFIMDPDRIAQPEFIVSHVCSGCEMGFSTFSGLQMHLAVWSSGGNPLSCMTVMPQIR